MDSKKIKDLCEAYGSIYEPKVELTEEQVWEEVENWVNSLLEEGYDLSDYTWEEMYEAYIEEQERKPPQGDVGYRVGRGLVGALKDFPSALGSQFSGKPNAAAIRQGQRGDNLRTLLKTGKLPGSNQGSVRTTPTPQPQSPLVGADGRNVFDGTSTRPSAATPAASRPVPPVRPAAAATTPAASRPAAATPAASRPAAATPAASRPAPAPAAQTGDKEKDMATWEKENPTLANKPKTPNPLLAGGEIRRMQQASQMRQKGIDITSDQIKSAERTKPSTKNESSEWGSTSKLVNDIANAYKSVYESKKIDQDEDGDNDFADVRIARMIASGMSKEEAIRRVKDKAYNEEYKPWDFGPKQKARAKHSELAARKAAGGSAPGTATRANKIASVGREMRTTLDKNSAATGANPAKQGLQPATQRHTLAAMRGAGGGTTASKMYDVKPLKPTRSSRGGGSSAQGLGSAGSPSGSTGRYQVGGSQGYGLSGIRLADDFNIWVNSLLEEGYDLSDYTWEEMYQVYEEYISEDPVQNYRDMKRSKENAAGMRGPELSHSTKPKPLGSTNQSQTMREIENAAGMRGPEFARPAQSNFARKKGPPLQRPGYGNEPRKLSNSYEIEGDLVDESAKRTSKKIRGAKDPKAEMAGRSDAGKRISGDEKTGPRYYTLGRSRGATPDAPTQPGARPVNTPKLSSSEKEYSKYRHGETMKGIKKGYLKVGGSKGLPEEIELWIESLLEEGYDLSTWSNKEIVDLYNKIFD